MKNERQPILERERRAEPALWMETVQTTVLCAAFSGTAETPSQIFASGRTNKCLAGLERTSRMTSFFFYTFFCNSSGYNKRQKPQAASLKALYEQTLSAREKQEPRQVYTLLH